MPFACRYARFVFSPVVYATCCWLTAQYPRSPVNLSRLYFAESDVNIVVKEAFLDTRAVRQICRDSSISSLRYIQKPVVPLAHSSPPAQWLQRLLQTHCDKEAIERACSGVPHLATYRLPEPEREVVVQRLVASLGLGPSDVAFARAWVGEMERFLLLKAIHGDTEADILLPSGMSPTAHCCWTLCVLFPVPELVSYNNMKEFTLGLYQVLHVEHTGVARSQLWRIRRVSCRRTKYEVAKHVYSKGFVEFRSCGCSLARVYIRN